MRCFPNTDIPIRTMYKWKLAAYMDVSKYRLKQELKAVEGELEKTGYKKRQHQLLPVQIRIILIHMGYFQEGEKIEDND